MKKLIMTAAIVCAAVGAQAAAVDWSFTETVKKANYGTQVDLTSYTAYLITQSAWESFTALADDQRTADAFGALAKADSASITTTAGDWSTTSTSKYGTGSQQADVASGNFYIILTDGNGYAASTVAEGTSYDHNADPLPSHKDPAWTIATTKTPLGTSSFTSFAGAGGGSETIPEPTSGLLLLLGVAGLALRRRA